VINIIYGYNGYVGSFILFQTVNAIIQKSIKTRRAQTCALPLFCDSDLEINPVTLKLEGDLDILKMYLQTKNEVARSSHSKYIT